MSSKVNLTLDNLDTLLSEHYGTDHAKTAAAKTVFLKQLSLRAHKYYGGKMQTLPRAGVFGFNWFNVWYTPGVSAISTAIRDNNLSSWDLSNRGNYVAVVSDSTRVLGDGDCTPPGGLGVMEGKSFLMKYLGGIDATAICMNSRNKKGEHDPDKIIDFVKMIQPSFGAINLEDISQPNCYKVLDTLREECEIPVWHDDAQGTASVTLAGLINALKLAEKDINKVRIVLLGAGAANATIARIIIEAGGDPEKMAIFDSRGSLNRDREDIKADKRFYRKWELCLKTDQRKYASAEEAIKGADVLIALSKPGPDTVKPEWISGMAKNAIVFACANPVPEIYPYAAKKAGAFIVATGRGDFPNQVNNSVGFPGILKGALLVRAKKISDGMAIAAARALAGFAEKRGINPDNIIATMEEPGVFPFEAAEVAVQAVKEGLSSVKLTHEEVFRQAEEDIKYSRSITEMMIKNSYIQTPPVDMLQEVFDWTIGNIR
ncbi:MAG: NADP-dependent malic enzyme [Spirochaetales bacterium]|nr:NADP-dependent malic enzyme [Spirochaetales bacterium]